MREDFAGLSYPARHQLRVAEGAALTIYVPAPGVSLDRVAPGSGIVGEPMDSQVLIHYEGWVNGRMQYADRDARGLWQAGVEHAAGRAFVAYPTIARRLVEQETLTPVGTIAADGTLHITDEKAVQAWLSS